MCDPYKDENAIHKAVLSDRIQLESTLRNTYTKLYSYIKPTYHFAKLSHIIAYYV